MLHLHLFIYTFISYIHFFNEVSFFHEASKLLHFTSVGILYSVQDTHPTHHDLQDVALLIMPFDLYNFMP